MDDLNAPAPAEQTAIDTPAPVEAPVSAPETNTAAQEPKEAPKRSRMESLEKAFEQVDKAEKAESKPVETTGEQPRGPDGKFVAKEAPVETKPIDAKAEKPVETAKAPISEAPSRFSPDAKAAWKDAPEPVRGEIQRAISELETGIAQKDEQIKPLKPFFDMAQKHGVRLDQALSNYVNMENMLRERPAEGLRALAQNMGMTPQQMASLITDQPGQGNDAAQREILRLNQKISDLEQRFGQVSETVQTQRQNSVLQEVQAFADAHPRFGELENEILRMLETGYASDLADAYTKAERLVSAPPSPVQPALAPLAQTRPALSVTGAPNAGSNPGNRQPSKNRSDALARAFAQAGLA